MIQSILCFRSQFSQLDCYCVIINNIKITHMNETTNCATCGSDTPCEHTQIETAVEATEKATQ